MSELYFSIPYGTREMSFGITEGGEIWNFYLIFTESEIMKLRQVIVYSDCKEDGTLTEEARSELYKRHEGHDDVIEFEFGMSESRNIKIYLYMTEQQYDVCVNY